MVNGIEGFLRGTVLDFEETLFSNDLEKLKTTPGAYLGSCRYKLPEDLDDPVYPVLFQKFKELSIGYFFYIGITGQLADGIHRVISADIEEIANA